LTVVTPLLALALILMLLAIVDYLFV
jgi:hypothetical protein